MLTEEEIVALASEFDVVHLDDGEILLNQGETVDTIFILERGKLRSLEGGGIESNGKPIMPGHILAVRESLAQDPVDRMIASDGPSRLLVLSMDRAKEALGMNLSDLIRNRRKEKRDSSSAQAAVRIQVRPEPCAPVREGRGRRVCMLVLFWV